MKKISIHPKMRQFLSKSFSYIKNMPSPDMGQQTIQRIFSCPTDFKEKMLENLKKNEHVIEQKKGISKLTNQKKNPLDDLYKEIITCKKCFLGQSRGKHLALPDLKTPEQIEVVTLVDKVSYYDQIRGEYFLDEVGEMIKKILKALKIPWKSVYTTAAIKCTKAQEFGDKIDETAVCLTYLKKELAYLKPKLILAFGEVTYHLLKSEIKENLKQEISFEEIRGRVVHYLDNKIVFTYHPQRINRNPSLKKETWDNLKQFTNKIK